MATRPISPAPVELRAAHILLFAAVAVPGLALTATGIVSLALHRFPHEVVLGILTLAFALWVIVGGFAAWLLVRRGELKTRLHHDFVSSVSHELRTPLTGIRVLVETLRLGRVDSAQAAQCLELIELETRRLTTLVEEVLEFGRLQSGSRRFRIAPIAAAALVEQARQDFAALRLGAEVELVVECAPDLIVKADRRAVAEVLSNLLSNAIKYGGDGGRVWLRVGRAGEHAAFAVEDQGPGVSPLLRRKIFEEFFRADDAATRAKPGTGLGLAIARSLVRGQKGTIHVESRPGGGSRFVFTLPLASAAVAAALTHRAEGGE